MMSITAFGSNLYAFFRDIDHDLRSTRKNIPSTAAGFGSSSWKPTLVVAAAELILGSTQPSQEPDASMDEFEAGSGDETYEKHCGASVALFTWPSAILLSCFLTANQELICGRRVLEIGAGTGLPSAVAHLLGASWVCATDRDESSAVALLRETFRLNGIHSGAAVRPLCWKSLSIETVTELAKAKYDMILGSDVLYSTEDFDDVLGLIAILLENSLDCDKNISPAFYTVYQDRSYRRSLKPYLDKYELKAEAIPTAQFLAQNDGNELGAEMISTMHSRCSCLLIPGGSCPSKNMKELSELCSREDLPLFESMEDLYLIKITLL